MICECDWFNDFYFIKNYFFDNKTIPRQFILPRQIKMLDYSVPNINKLLFCFVVISIVHNLKLVLTKDINITFINQLDSFSYHKHILDTGN